MSKNRLVGVLLAVFLCSATVPCQGVLMETDVSDLYRHADVVLIGDVLNITTHRGGTGIIYRKVVVGVERYNKNSLELSHVDVQVLGGVIDGNGWSVEDQPEFEVGETVLIFLAYHEKHPDFPAEGYHVVGGPKGKFTVADGVATTQAGDKLELTDSLGLPAIFVASELCIHQWGECAENVNITFIVTNVGEAAGYFNASFFYQDSTLEGAGVGGYGIMDVYLEAGESWTVSASDVFVAELPGVYEVEADTELFREDYRNPLTMSFEVLGEVDEATPVEGARENQLPKDILSLILLIVFLLIVRLVVYRRAPKADYLEPTPW
jgi:hypothetical protein